MNAADRDDLSISVRLQDVTEELRKIQDCLSSAKDIDPSILTDFRDAVNRVRNTAWAVEQYASSKATESDPNVVLSLVAGERVRVAYQLSKLIQSDLENPNIRFQKGQLIQYREAAKALEARLLGVVEA